MSDCKKNKTLSSKYPVTKNYIIKAIYYNCNNVTLKGQKQYTDEN